MVQMKNILALCGAGMLLFLNACKNESEAGAELYERYQAALLAEDAAEKERASDYLQQAAENGHALAMCRLGQRLMATGKPEDTTAGFAWMERAAATDDAEGLYLLGLCYDQGRGTEKNPDLAAECWRKAAALNHAPALVTLGMAYANGYGGLEKNMEKAVENYGQAALLEDARGYYCMAVCYDQGKGVEKDAAKAVAYARRAAEQQHSDACLFMGKAHLLGYGGVEKSPALAAPYLLKAADAGNADAALRLGKLAFDGTGIKKDYSLAARCFQLAAQGGIRRRSACWVPVLMPGLACRRIRARQWSAGSARQMARMPERHISWAAAWSWGMAPGRMLRWLPACMPWLPAGAILWVHWLMLIAC